MTREHPIIRLKANSSQVIQEQVCPVRKTSLQSGDEVVLCTERGVAVTLEGWREMEMAWGGKCPYCGEEVTLPKRPVSPPTPPVEPSPRYKPARKPSGRVSGPIWIIATISAVLCIGGIALGMAIASLVSNHPTLTPTPPTPVAVTSFTPTPTPVLHTPIPLLLTATPTLTCTPPPQPTAIPTTTPTPEWICLTNSTKDFSDVQGTNNWYYMASNGRDSGDFQEIPWDPKDEWWEWCYDPALGKAPCSEKYVGWRSDFGHPGMYADIAKVWMSTVSGALKIVGSVRKEHGGGDGVLVEIYHWHSSGRDKLWTTTIEASDVSPKSFGPMITEAGKGDKLFFVLKIRGRPEWDKTFLDVTICTSASVAVSTPTTKPASKPTVPLAITNYKNKIVFRSDRERGEALYVMNPDGSDQRRLNNESVYYSALALEAISLDGKWILEVKEFDGNTDIYKVDIARTQSYQRITSDSQIDQEPVWSPIDLNRIAFVSTRMGSTDIWTQNVNEPLEERRLTDNPDYDKHPSWSPDGTHIVYWAVHGGGPRQIWVMNADGSNKRNISNNPHSDWDPIWIKQP